MSLHHGEYSGSQRCKRELQFFRRTTHAQIGWASGPENAATHHGRGVVSPCTHIGHTLPLTLTQKASHAGTATRQCRARPRASLLSCWPRAQYAYRGYVKSTGSRRAPTPATGNRLEYLPCFDAPQRTANRSGAIGIIHWRTTGVSTSAYESTTSRIWRVITCVKIKWASSSCSIFWPGART